MIGAKIDELELMEVSYEDDPTMQMLNQEMVHRDFGSVEERFAGIAGGGPESSLLRADQEEARATALARAEKHVAIEAQDVLSQADEALVLG